MFRPIWTWLDMFIPCSRGCQSWGAPICRSSRRPSPRAWWRQGQQRVWVVPNHQVWYLQRIIYWLQVHIFSVNRVTHYIQQTRNLNFAETGCNSEFYDWNKCNTILVSCLLQPLQLFSTGRTLICLKFHTINFFSDVTYLISIAKLGLKSHKSK